MYKNRQKFGFTLVELLVVIAIIALLMAILLPALNRAREQGKRAVCIYNVKTLSIAYMMYLEDYEGTLPPGCTKRTPDRSHYERSFVSVCKKRWRISVSCCGKERIQNVLDLFCYELPVAVAPCR